MPELRPSISAPAPPARREREPLSRFRTADNSQPGNLRHYFSATHLDDVAVYHDDHNTRRHRDDAASKNFSEKVSEEGEQETEGAGLKHMENIDNDLQNEKDPESGLRKESSAAAQPPIDPNLVCRCVQKSFITKINSRSERSLGRARMTQRTPRTGPRNENGEPRS